MGLEDLRERPPGDGQVLPPVLEQNIRFTLSKRCVCVPVFIINFNNNDRNNRAAETQAKGCSE